MKFHSFFAVCDGVPLREGDAVLWLDKDGTQTDRFFVFRALASPDCVVLAE